MVDADGTISNKFDRGWFSNILEFWHVPGYAIDYTKVFELPTPPLSRSKYMLTHDNIMRYSSPGGGGGGGGGGAGAGGVSDTSGIGIGGLGSGGSGLGGGGAFGPGIQLEPLHHQVSMSSNQMISMSSPQQQQPQQQQQVAPPERATTNSIHNASQQVQGGSQGGSMLGRYGPPSIDFDMTKLRGDSMDSNDTNGSMV
jgi:hypothetical protein